MNENMMRSQFNSNAYNFLSQARNIYQIYIRIKQDLNFIDNKIVHLSRMYIMNPMRQHLIEQKQLSDNKFQKQMNLQQYAVEIANNLGLSTQNALQAMQISVNSKDSMNIMLDNNTINTICSFIELVGMQTDIANLYRQYCNTGIISFLLSDIEIGKGSIQSYNFSGFNRLKNIILNRP